MIVLGIDPGSRVTGYGVIAIEGTERRVVDYGVVKPETGASQPIRLKQIYNGMVEVIDATLPDSCAVEMPIYGRNAQSMLKLGRAQAAAMLAAMSREIPVVEYTPKEIKKAVTGNGNATKSQVWFMLQKLLALEEDRGLDASDALAVGLCHSHRLSGGLRTGSGNTSWASFVKANPERIAE